jgi:peptide/nickel transport system substrate-binding protein
MSDDLMPEIDVPAVSSRSADTVPGLRTFLIADVRGYTSFTQRSGDEKAGALVARFAQAAREVVADDGTVLELRGDEALCVFASPRQALRTAVALQQRFVAETQRDPDLPLPVGIGIDVGEAVEVEGGYRGGALNLAARLCSLAGPGEILATSETVHLARRLDGVSYLPVQAVRVQGLEEPVRIVRVVPDEDPVRRLAALRAPPAEPPTAPGPRWLPPRLRRRPVLAAGAIVTALAAAAAATVVAVSLGSPQPSTLLAEGVAGILDPATGALTGQIPLGGTPTALAAGAGVVWVVDTDDDSVGRIEMGSRRLTQTIDVGGAPTSVAVGDGSVWVANSTSGTVTRIDPVTGRVRQTVQLGGAPAAVVFDHDALWITDVAAAAVLRLDPATGTVTARIAVGDAPAAIVAGEGELWVSNSGDGTVTRIDPVQGIALSSLHVGNDPRGIALDGASLWVTNNLDNTVTRVATATGTVVATIAVGSGPVAVAVASGKVWVANQDGASISEIDPARNTVAATVATASQPATLVVAGKDLWVAVGPQPARHRGGTFRALIADVLLDPDGQDAPSSPVLRMLFDGLVAQRQAPGSAGYVVVPDLAIGLPAPGDGGLSYTFRLRPGVRWSTGASVTGHDVRRGIERAIALGAITGSGIIGADACTSDACDLSTGVAVDERSGTITIHLATPQPEFLLDLAGAAAVPASTPLSPVAGPLPATGPYEVADFRPHASLALVRNPHFSEWSHAAQPTGFPDRFLVTLDPSWGDHPDADARRAGFDWIDVRGADLTALQARAGNRVRISPRLVVRYAFLNTRVPPFDNLDARRAVSYAVDRAAIAADWPDPAEVTCQVLPPTVPGYRPYCPYTLRPDATGTWHAPDLATAQRLVQQSGTAGASVTVWAVTINQRAMQHVVDAMNDIGYHATLHVLPPTTFFDDLTQHPEVQAGFVGWIGNFPSASQFTNVSTCDAIGRGQNYAYFCDPSVDALIASALDLGAQSPQTAGEAWAAVDRRLTDEVPLVPLVVDTNAVLVSSRVRHYEVDPSGGILDQAWLR